MYRIDHLPGQIADVAFGMAATKNVGIDAEDVDGVPPELKFVGIILDSEGDAARVVLFYQAVLMECARLPLARAFVTGVVAGDVRIVSQSFCILSNYVV